MRAPLALALAAALGACQRPQPSADYERARALHGALVARAPLDPYAQPEMTQVLALLARVPADSSDAEAARALREKVESEVRAEAEERIRRDRLVAGAGSAAAPPATEAGASPAESPAPPAEEVAAPPASKLAAGTTLSEFQQGQGECFEAKAPARIALGGGKTVEGQAWGLKETEACRQAHPEEVGRVVLFADGKLLEVRQVSEARAARVTRKVQGELRPDGTVALPKGVELPPGAQVEWGKLPSPQPGPQPAPAR